VNKHSVSSRNGSRTRRRFSPSQIEQYLAEFERGDLSGAAFARQAGLCYSSFCRWRKQRERPARPSAAPRLQPVPIGSLLGPVWAAEIIWPNGPTLRLQERIAPDWANELIEALRRSC
jgi:transposase-like protein